MEFSLDLLKTYLTSFYRDGHVAKSLNKVFILDDEFRQNILNERLSPKKFGGRKLSVPTHSNISHLSFWQEDSMSPPPPTHSLMKRGMLLWGERGRGFFFSFFFFF